MNEPAHFSDRLLAALERAGAPACVGIDPVYERMPEAMLEATSGKVEPIERFSLGVIDAVTDVVGVVKLQSACFERYGHDGMAALERTAQHARDAKLLVILDAKRGDIGLTSEHYAAWAFDTVGADAVTLNPYLGVDAITPFLDAQWSAGRGRGVFALVRTSNPSSDAIQSATLAGGETVASLVADLVRETGAGRTGERGFSDVCAVVAATKPADAALLRAKMPAQIFLAPGFGAQGGSTETIQGLFLPTGLGALVTASRSVIYAFDASEPRWMDHVHDAAVAFATQAQQAAQRARELPGA